MKLNAVLIENSRLTEAQQLLIASLPENWSVAIDGDKLVVTCSTLDAEVMIKGAMDLIPIALEDTLKESSSVEDAQDDFVATLEEQGIAIRNCCVELDPDVEIDDDGDDDDVQPLPIKSVTLVFESLNDAAHTMASLSQGGDFDTEKLETLSDDDLKDLCGTLKKIVKVDWHNLF